jgi:hypothetical protein
MKMDSCSSARDPDEDTPTNFAQEISRALSGKNIQVSGWSSVIAAGDIYGLNVKLPSPWAEKRVYVDGVLVKK